MQDGFGIRATSAGATVAPPAIALPRPRARWWVELLTIAWLCWVDAAVPDLAPLRIQAALAHARSILNAEQSLRVAPEHSLDRWLAAHHTIALVLSDYYDNAHFVVTLGLLGWLWWKRSDVYRPLRTALVLTNLIAFLVFWLFPVAPPRMLPGFTDVVASTHAIGSWHSGSLASHANQYAAMPSLHIGWAVWCTAVVWITTRRRWLRALATVYPFVTAFAVLSTGNHFVMDMLGGLAVAALAGAIVIAGRRLAPRLSGAAAGSRSPA